MGEAEPELGVGTSCSGVCPPPSHMAPPAEGLGGAGQHLTCVLSPAGHNVTFSIYSVAPIHCLSPPGSELCRGRSFSSLLFPGAWRPRPAVNSSSGWRVAVGGGTGVSPAPLLCLGPPPTPVQRAPARYSSQHQAWLVTAGCALVPSGLFEQAGHSSVRQRPRWFLPTAMWARRLGDHVSSGPQGTSVLGVSGPLGAKWGHSLSSLWGRVDRRVHWRRKRKGGAGVYSELPAWSWGSRDHSPLCS